MKPDDFEIEDYRSLRNSIDMHMKLIPEIFSIMIVATSALLGVGFKYQLFLIFLLPAYIILSFGFLIRAQMDEIMLKGAYIKRRYEKNIFGWESTLFALREIKWKKAVNMCKLQRPFVKAADDAKAYLLIMDILLIICFIGFLYTVNIVSVVSLFWIPVVLFTYQLNREILKAYTFEKEQRILNELDKVFKSTEEPTPQGKTE